MAKTMEKILTNKFMYLAFFVVGYLGWFFKVSQATTILLCFFVMLILIFCDDPKGIFMIILPIQSFTWGIQQDSDYIYYGIAIGLGGIGVLYYFIKQIFIKKMPVTKGKMFWGFICITIACMLGGSIYHFSIMPKFSIFGLCFLMYFIYFFTINFAKNMKEFMRTCFVACAIFIVIQILTMHIQTGDFFKAILSKSVVWVGGQHINSAALYVVLGALSMFWLAYEKKKYDYLYCLGGVALIVATYFTYGRIALFAGVIFAFVCILIIFIKSNHKAIFLIAFAVILGSVAIFAALRWDRFVYLISAYIKIGFGGNGREVLWPWCFERFLREPFFGIGFFTYNDPVPTIALDNVVFAHNTILQFLTSTGIIGCALVGYFYFWKYRILFNDFKKFDLFTLLISLFFALVGMVDPNVTMDMFVIMIWIMLIALAESINKEIEETEQKEKTENSVSENKLKKSKKRHGVIEVPEENIEIIEKNNSE